MSIVVIGDRDHMISQYRKVYRDYRCKVEVFTQMSTSLDKQVDNPSLLVLFTNTVSHKMMHCALNRVGSGTETIRCHTGGGIALIGILEERCAVCAI